MVMVVLMLLAKYWQLRIIWTEYCHWP